MLSGQIIAEIAQDFAARTNYIFKNSKLLIQALTRSSSIGVLVDTNAEDFESLEFLGDRALNLAITSKLINLYPKATPGELSRRYVALTRNSDGTKRNGGPLYRVAKELNLEALILKSDTDDIARFGDRGQKISQTKKTKEGILSDHTEAIIGAIYLDSDDGRGSGFLPVIEFVYQFWHHMGLNEECVSESNFGNSDISSSAIVIQAQIRQNKILLATAKKNNWPQAQLALQNSAEIETVDENNQTALLHFSAWGNTDAVVDLLNRGANIEHADHNGWTAVLHAAAKGRFSVLRLLLSEGAKGDIEALMKNSVKVTILSLATAKNYNQIITYITINYLYLFSAEQLEDAKTQAIANSKLDAQALIQRAILQKNKNTTMFEIVNDMVVNGETLDKIKSLKECISNGADVRIRDIDNDTIFHWLVKLACANDLLVFILNTKPKLDSIILSNLPPDTFANIEELSNLSFRHSDLTNVSFASIKRFINIDFSEATLIDVVFHPEVKFEKTNFKNAHVNSSIPATNLGSLALHHDSRLSIFTEASEPRASVNNDNKHNQSQTGADIIHQAAPHN